MSAAGSREDSREPEPKEGKSEEIFEVERILSHKVTDNMLLLQVRWAGYGPDEDTWEPEEDLKECASEVVAEYYRKLKVNDKTELIELLQKQIKRNKTLKTKKRERTVSDDDDASHDSDGSFTTPKKSKKSKKSTKSETPISSKAPKVPTKAALKSYEATVAGPVTPNNAKKAAMEVRDHRLNWLEDSSDDEADAPAPESEIEKIANKVKGKVVKETVHAPIKEPSEVPKPKAEIVLAKKEKNQSPQPCSSSVTTLSNKKKTGSLEPNGRQRTLAPPVVEKEETLWTVNGIVRHTDESNNRKKLILMTNSVTGDRKVVDSKEAYDLDGWALTKYLLDRCEF